MTMIDELVGYAKANARAATTQDERMTWEAHHRNCLIVQAETERLIEALNIARTGLLNIERRSEEARAAITGAANT